MASYDNLMAEQPWSFHTAFSDAWFCDPLAKLETKVLTKALQSSFPGASSTGGFFPSGMEEPLFSMPDTTPVQTPTVSSVSENDALVSKQRQSVPPRGRVAKRKSRPSKRAATTTFIAADPENFMQMVQQVTGVKLGGFDDQLPVAQLLRPVAHRAVEHLWPTLDTSAYLLDAASSMVCQPSKVVAYGGAGASEHYFDSFCSFPTLESWKAVD